MTHMIFNSLSFWPKLTIRIIKIRNERKKAYLPPGVIFIAKTVIKNRLGKIILDNFKMNSRFLFETFMIQISVKAKKINPIMH